MHWQKTKSEAGPDLKLFRTRFDWMVNPRNGHEEKMVVLEGGDSVQIIAINDTDQMLLVRQYRFGAAEYLLELPGGLIDAGEDPLTAAQRELREETGHTATNWQALGNHFSNPVFMESKLYHYTATGIQFKYEPQLDEGEDVALVQMDKAEVKIRLLRGEFQHPHTVCGLLAYFAAVDTSPVL